LVLKLKRKSSVTISEVVAMVLIRVAGELLFAEKVCGGYVCRDLRRAGEFFSFDEVEEVTP